MAEEGARRRLAAQSEQVRGWVCRGGVGGSWLRALGEAEKLQRPLRFTAHGEGLELSEEGTVATKGSFETCLMVAALMATPPAIAARALQRLPKYSVSRNFQMSCRQLRTMQQRDPVIIQRGASVAPTTPQYRHSTVRHTMSSCTSTSKNCCRPKATNEQFER